MTTFALQGARECPEAAASLEKQKSQLSSSSVERALIVGKHPMMPALHAADTNPDPDTRNIGAAISGRRNRFVIESGKRDLKG
jgi:hypothetical protein